MVQLITQSEIRARKAVMTKKEQVILKLEHGPFRNTKPRNRGGWMIQAIEGNYQATLFYFEERQRRRAREQLAAAQALKLACAICKRGGFRSEEAVIP